MSAEALRQASRFQAVFEDAPVAIWYEDFSAVKSFLDGLRPTMEDDLTIYLELTPAAVSECLRRVRVKHVNRMAREFYGAETPDQIASSLPSLFDPAALEIFRNELIAFLGGARSFVAEVNATTLGGLHRLVQMNVALLATPGDDWSEVVVAFTDLTERRELEQSLQRANESLHQSNERLEQFAYAAAHELQEPLRTIGLYAEFLKKMDLNSLGPQAEAAARFILDATGRMKELITDLLAFAQPLGVPSGPHEAVTDTEAVVRDTLATLKASVSEAEAEIDVGDLPPVSADPSHLRQVFQNLISNALKYRRRDHRPHVQITSEQNSAETTFCVADNGLGISSDYHEQVFAIFKRLHGREVEGTGIGLALCKRIVEHYNGRIWVESQGGSGSRFYFTIPRAIRNE